MSAKRGRARGTMDGQRRLVLVRGGRDSLGGAARPPVDGTRPAAGDADWQSFCGRIGWQQPGSQLAENDEQRMIEGIVLSAGGRSVEETGATSTGVPNELTVARTAEARWPLRRRRGARDPFLASTAMAAAAALFLFLAAAFSWAQQRSARATPVPARDLAHPVDDRAAPIRTQPAPPVECAPEPAPSETATPIEGREPGSLVADARASRKQAPRNRGSRARQPIAARAAEATDDGLAGRAEPAPEPLDGHSSLAASEFTAAPFERVERVGGSSARSPIAIAPAHAMWNEPGTAAAMARPHSASAGPASWAVSSTSDRWYGVTLPPSGDPERFPANVGVLAQVDLGKALRL